ncbi:alpha-L-fucosidase [Flavivirga amylovorans]|uniref:alpha-L-fucosidase n=1 Tax=Flavivirga amylovorans TaxID=870486 RepID=A0ABT8WX71_9FLAO|nr:alpha-L-fucosidase [Flavivirga amylovorans]MDO5986217.1 alpha-L-fucosidase [Flavivirga amylovorans]
MKYLLALLIVFSIVFTSCESKKKQDDSKKVPQTPKYQANWESIRKNYKDAAWFQDAKFGIFLHWGPYAVPAHSSEKYPKGIYQESWRKNRDSITVWNYHRKHYGEPSEFGYKDLFPLFKAEKFNAQEWINLFKKAGAKYVVPVAEHHDGFAMYNSKVTRWNVVNMGPKKDIMRALKDEAEKQGLKFGMSSHFALNRQYYSHKDPNWDTNDPEFQDLYWKKVDKGALPTQEFLDVWWNRTTDIIDQYEPDLLWFDFGLDKPGFTPVHKKILAYYYNKGEELGKEVVFQDKNMKGNSFPEDLIVLDLERGRMDKINKMPWQTDTSIGKKSWGYIRNEDYKESGYLIDELIDIVSKNGCLLLNIGPKADGTIPTEAISILEDIGAWLHKNGEAIYGTRPWKIFGEGPTEVSAGNHSEHNNKAFGSKDIRFTTKGDNLYAIAMDWSKDGSYLIRSLANENPYESKAITSVDFLSGENPIQWEQTKEGLKINIEGEQPGDVAFAFKINF